MFDPKTFVAGLPNFPGVYRMLGPSGEALYIGKARDLKKRVASYFQKQAASPRTQVMLTQVASMEVTVTRSEAEALLLENNLIKSLAPRYNILFRDDKSYPYLMVTGHPYPRLGFHRGAKDRKNRYFGPFPHAYAVRESIQLMQRVFRLRTCEDTVFENRSRPCLLYQIRRCTAPCTGNIAPAPYAEDVRNAMLFLEGREDDVVNNLSEKMKSFSEAQRYEEAAAYRDQVRALSRIQARQYVESNRGVDADVVACVIDGVIACVNLVMIRGGVIAGTVRDGDGEPVVNAQVRASRPFRANTVARRCRNARAPEAFSRGRAPAYGLACDDHPTGATVRAHSCRTRTPVNCCSDCVACFPRAVAQRRRRALPTRDSIRSICRGGMRASVRSGCQ